jgi:molecular chaperone GrpE
MPRDDTKTEGGAEELLVEAVPAEPARPPEPEDPAKALEKAQTEAREGRERMLRIAADFENFKKRNERERNEFLKFANERLLRELLTLADNLARAVEAGRKAGESPTMTAGVDLVLQELMKVLKKFGLEAIDAVDRPFDPTYHEALQQVETDEHEPGTVLWESQRGYTLHGRLLRPSLVAVASAPEVTSPSARIPDDLK